MKSIRATILTGAALILAASQVAAQEVERFDFSAVARIEVDGTSGDVFVMKADGRQGYVELRQDVTPRENFRGEVNQSGETLRIVEHWRGNTTRGHVEWRIYLPEGGTPPRLTVDTASGDLDCTGVAASVRFDTASGDIELRNVRLGTGSRFDTASGDIDITSMTVADGTSFDTASGDITLDDVTIGDDVDFDTASGDITLDNVVIGEGCNLSTASGNVRAFNSRGAFELSSASGDVDMRECALTGPSEFSTASGDVTISLTAMVQHDLRGSSASGDVTLAIDDWGSNFTLILVKRRDRGRITCPFEFASERTFEEYNTVYEEKIVRQGSGGPEIHISTASGSLVIRR